MAPAVISAGTYLSSPAGQPLTVLASRYGVQLSNRAPTTARAISTQIFSYGPAIRGRLGEGLLGVADDFWNFPVIDKFDKLRGIATSIKTVDIFNSYQGNALFNALTRTVDALKNFKGASRGDITVRGSQIQRRVLTLIVPGGDLSQLKPEIQAQIHRFLQYACQRSSENVVF